MISFIHCAVGTNIYRFPKWQQVSWSSIKYLTLFEDDTEIRLLSFLMYANSQKILFIKMASLKIDFLFEVFKQLKDHVLSYFIGAT